MRKLFAAAVLLAASALTAGAQDGKTTHAVPTGPSTQTAQCEPGSVPTDDAFAPPTRCKPVTGRQPFLSSPKLELAQSPPGDAHERPADSEPDSKEPESKEADAARAHFRWGSAFKQTLLFLSVQHGYALTQPKTRRDLHGPFLKDYFRSVRSLHGWADGGRFFTNYIAHPMEGSLLGFIQIQNDPRGSRLKFNDAGYWRSRFKALAWSAAWSTQFEIGPVSQASIGNVGLHGKQTYVDIVMTPTGGFGLLMAEDVLDRYVVERLERRSQSRYVRIFGRMIFNPTRTAANLLRFEKPWHRDMGLR